MQQITQLTNASLQLMTLILPSGSSFQMVIYFRPMQLLWTIQSLTYQSFTLTEVSITNNANILNQWRNILPFGLACFSNSSREPTQQQDFSSGASTLYILTPTEVAQYVEFLNSGQIQS